MACNNSILPLIKPAVKVCEIGIRRGDSTLEFLKLGCFVYMIDPWEDYPEYDEKNYDYLSDYSITLERIKGFEGRYQIFRKKSEDAVDEIPDDLDLVYIDGNHAYDFVKEDIVNYWPKIKEGGWLTGDDYGESGVSEAVNEFAEKNKLKIQIFAGNWAIQK